MEIQVIQANAEKLTRQHHPNCQGNHCPTCKECLAGHTVYSWVMGDHYCSHYCMRQQRGW